MKIQKLPPEVVAKLQSGIVITDAVQCMLELVYNSLDAKATAVAVRVDLKDYKIQVIDNGLGIARRDLENVGERYMTNKYHSFIKSEFFTTYGFKGHALSSLLDVCRTLRIETKTKKNAAVLTKVFENKVESKITEDVGQCNAMDGTIVTVEDFMYSMPIRRKRINEIFDLDEMKSHLKYLAIIHHNVSFTLRNENKCLILFQTQCTSNILISVKNIFGASLAKALTSVNLKYKGFRLTGLVSKKPQCNNTLQTFYVNKRLITKGMIHRLVNDILNKYITEASPSTNSMEENILKNLRGVRNHVFILEIACSKSSYELFGSPKKCTVEFKAWKDVLICIKKAIKNVFCSDHHIDSTVTKKPKCDEQLNLKKKYGTSALVNAVKGKPAVRKSRAEDRNNKQHNPTKFDCSLFKEIMEIDSLESNKTERKKHTAMANSFLHESATDSLESPIPKKLCKLKIKENPVHLENVDTTMINQCFFHFNEWLKENIKTDINAYKVFQNFLNENQKSSKTKNSIVAKQHTALGRKPERKKTVKYNYCKRQLTGEVNNEITTDLNQLRKDYLCVQNRKQTMQTFFSNEPERVCHHNSKIEDLWKYLFSSEKTCDANNDYLSNVHCSRVIKTQQDVISRPDRDNVNTFQILNSPAQSESFFYNFLKFRNLTESPPDSQSPFKRQSLRNDNSNSWTSHYQRSMFTNSEFLEAIRKPHHDNLPLMEIEMSNSCRNITSHKEEEEEMNLFSQRQNPGINNHQHCTEKHNSTSTCSVGVQYPDIHDNMTFLVGKKDAAVQTEANFITEIQSKTPLVETIPVVPVDFESCHSKEENRNDLQLNSIACTIRSDEPVELTNVSTNEIPCPGFWNTPNGENVNETDVPLFTCDLPVMSNHTENEKASTSSEIICCSQKINSLLAWNTNDSCASSKDTNGVTWTNCLERLRKGVESSLQMSDSIFSNSKSGSTQLTKTIPIEQIEYDSSANMRHSFYLTCRHDFIPKGLSPKLPSFQVPMSEVGTLSPRKKSEIKLAVGNTEEELLLESVKWPDESNGGITKPAIPDGILDEIRQRTRKNVINSEREIPSASLSYCAIKVHNLLHSFAFTKELLSTVEVIGQLDRKFIVAKMSESLPNKKELITLFDQHATDERIKLEELINEYILADGKFLSTSLIRPVKTELNESLVQVITNSHDKLENLGLKCKTVDGKTIEVGAVPKFLADKYAKDMKNKNYVSISVAVRDLIKSVLEELIETRGTLSQIPKNLYNLFCLDACHSAVKFNKPLTLVDMCDMINKLKSCKLPFQCAHGRPSVIPIIDLEDFKNIVMLNLERWTQKEMILCITCFILFQHEAEEINIEKVKKHFIN